ncbi:hypothetical protein KY366_05465 [Candidatus Woesearchaeota archaeon]|nr:hypothetical protein [Candidatus Woesearchaeota archaeon]
MIIREVVIDKKVKVKIYNKHGIRFREAREVLLNKPLARKTRDGRYMAVNRAERHITVIFSYYNGIADIVTAYPSSDWQIKLFKKVRK